MAATVYPSPHCGVAEEQSSKDLSWKDFYRASSKWRESGNSKPGQTYSDFKHEEPLWMSGWGDSSWAHGVLQCQTTTQEPCAGTLSSAQINNFVASLRACTRNKDLIKGISIHHDLMQRGLLKRCSNALVTMYAKCGELGKANELLDLCKSRDVFAWTALISGYASEGQGQDALDCLEKMQHEGILPNEVTYICALKACATIRAASRGKQIHDEIARQGLLQNKIALGNALVDMYAKCGDVSEAQRVLKELPSRDVVSWNALISGYAQEGEAEQALNCLEQMRAEGIEPDAVTYVCALKACATIRASDRGKQIHNEVSRQGMLQNHIVLGGALLNMYIKCGDISEARRVFEELPTRDVVSWSALLEGYAQEGEVEQVLNCLQQMQREGILPDGVMYVYALKCCAMIKDAPRGKQIHNEIARQGLLKNDIVLGNALVDMYAKCGDLSEARRVLEELPFRDVVSWNALVAGYAQEGEAAQALNSLEQMQCEGIPPNAVTLACVLNLCSHLGLVEVGQALFADMSTKYGLKPSEECYSCMIDLFGRAGHLEKGVRLIQEMPSSDFTAIWHTLLGACWKWTDVSVGEWAFEKAVKLDKGYGPAYVLMANIYAAAGMEEKAKSIEAMRIRNKA